MIRVDDRDDLNWIQGPGRGSDSAELRPPALSRRRLNKWACTVVGSTRLIQHQQRWSQVTLRTREICSPTDTN